MEKFQASTVKFQASTEKFQASMEKWGRDEDMKRAIRDMRAILRLKMYISHAVREAKVNHKLGKDHQKKAKK